MSDCEERALAEQIVSPIGPHCISVKEDWADRLVSYRLLTE